MLKFSVLVWSRFITKAFSTPIQTQTNFFLKQNFKICLWKFIVYWTLGYFPSLSLSLLLLVIIVYVHVLKSDCKCCVISLTSHRTPAHLISLFLVVTLCGLVFYALWLHPSLGLVVIVSTSPNTILSPDLKQGESHTHKPVHSDNSSLATLLTSLKFNNYGVVKSTDQLIMQDIPCW